MYIYYIYIYIYIYILYTVSFIHLNFTKTTSLNSAYKITLFWKQVGSQILACSKMFFLCRSKKYFPKIS